MKVRLKFRLKRPIVVRDHWPITVADSEVELIGEGGEIRYVCVIFDNQKPELSPTFSSAAGSSYQLKVKGELEGRAKTIVKRFCELINAFFTVDIDLEGFSAEYVPGNEQEREQVRVTKLDLSKSRPNTSIPFGILAQAFYAGEGSKDISFVSRMATLAREALIDHQYIDAFRYGFLLAESVYGGGHFRSRALIDAFIGNKEFASVINEVINEKLSSSLPADEEGKRLVESYSNPAELTKFLVSQRGIYFHGNAKQSAWHPERQESAKGPASIMVSVAAQIASDSATAMFAEGIGTRLFDDASRTGATIAMLVDVTFVDEHGFRSSTTWRVVMPGTKFTNDSRRCY